MRSLRVCGLPHIPSGSLWYGEESRRFFRGKAARDTATPGTGLGLAIAKEIVEQYRGRIEMESEGVPGRGATFTVWLPGEMPGS